MNRPMMHVVNPQTGESDPAQIRRVFESQLATALAWRESTAAERIARLKKLRDGMRVVKTSMRPSRKTTASLQPKSRRPSSCRCWTRSVTPLAASKSG